MVAVSFGSYAASTFAGENQAWIKFFAALIIIVMTGVNVVGSRLVAAAHTVIVTSAHLRIRTETGASLPILVLAIAAAGLDYRWKRSRPSSPVPVQVGP
jgi:hypothetical protein